MIRLEDLESADREDLMAAWTGIIGTPLPKGLSQTFIRRTLAYELQARDRGGLPKDFDARLSKSVAASGRRAAPALCPGGRLLREWNGRTHVVEVTAEGFLWKGQFHRSLSAIARAITGARWSGPRFFGLAGDSTR